MARLRVACGDGIEQIVELREQKLRIGRGRENDLVLGDSQKGVSRAHAELRYENGRYVILDLQSQNGTWVNGRRVERAEVPMGAEIALGEYRLTLLSGPEPSHAASDAAPTRSVSLEEFQIRQAPAWPDPGPQKRTSTRVPGWVITAIAITAVIAVAAVVRTLRPSVTGGRVPPPVMSPASSPDSSQAPPDQSAAASHARDRSAEPGQPDAAAGLNSLPSQSPVKPVVRPPSAVAVARRPGETVEAWHAREAALQTRYEYSKAALDRGDFAAAAGGFEAILIEEPGYRDAPRLLVQAQSALRATARGLFQAGSKLEAAGDWTGALQKYEQARQIYAGVPGLSEGLRRVQEKLRVAGTSAFNAARQHEANGRVQEALREYEKAVLWLPADDPNRQIARARVAELKRD